MHLQGLFVIATLSLLEQLCDVGIRVGTFVGNVVGIKVGTTVG
jgi:hypothetical protein